jgi:fused signal recognition particle receptor
MQNELILTPAQEIIFYIGSIGILIAFIFLFIRLRRPRSEAGAKSTKSRLGIESHLKTQITGDSSWWTALEKTRNRFALGFDKDIEGMKEELEEACLVTDMGVTNTGELLSAIDWQQLSSSPVSARPSEAKAQMASTVKAWLEVASPNSAESWPQKQSGPSVIWFVGTNGVGKTTTIAKLAKELQDRGHSVMLAAGDTFRAAASEQLETWAERLNIPCVRGTEGADSSAVLFDAIESAKSKNIDFVLCDSAGRLHNNSQLMDNLAKNKRVMAKALEGAPHETVLVLDANTGQNMLSQARTYTKDIGINALILTKVDGTARGGALIAVVRETGLPLRRLGLGEKPEDFKPFEAKAFAESLFG